MATAEVQRQAERYRSKKLRGKNWLADAQKVFNELRRLQGVWKCNGDLISTCVTCSKNIEYGRSKMLGFESMDCGHYRPATCSLTRFDKVNTACQCNHCNRNGSGEVAKFREHIKRTHGLGQLERVEAFSNIQGFKWNVETVAAMVLDWRKEIRELKRKWEI